MWKRTVSLTANPLHGMFVSFRKAFSSKEVQAFSRILTVTGEGGRTATAC